MSSPTSESERPWSGTVATGVGSLPGENIVDACRLVFDEVPDLPHLPELPQRGPLAGMIGRGCALLVDLHVDLGPAGWRVVHGAGGLDEQRARSLLAQDLDALEQVALGYEGPLKLQVAGPWTLAAGVERYHGGPVVGDSGARRDLAESLAEGVRLHLHEMRRRVPGARLLLQVDEPSLPAVIAGSLPTESGLSRLRAVEESEATERLATVVGAARGAGGWPVVHCCATDVPFRALVDCGASGIGFDPGRAGTRDLDTFAEAVDAGCVPFVGAVPGLPSTGPEPTEEELRRTVLGVWHRLGLSEEQAAQGCVVTPSCGLTGASPDGARHALRRAREVARRIGGAVGTGG